MPSVSLNLTRSSDTFSDDSQFEISTEIYFPERELYKNLLQKHRLSMQKITVHLITRYGDELKRIASLMLLDEEAISLQLPNTEMCFE